MTQELLDIGSRLGQEREDRASVDVERGRGTETWRINRKKERDNGIESGKRGEQASRKGIKM